MSKTFLNSVKETKVLSKPEQYKQERATST